MRGLCISLIRGWKRAVRSCRLHDLIPICQQRRNLLKSVITARTGNVRTESGSILGCVCRPADLGFRPRNPLEALDGMGELRAHRVWTMQPAQPNPQSPLNYAAMLITRECALKESLHSTQRLSLLSTVFHSPLLIPKGKTESQEFDREE